MLARWTAAVRQTYAQSQSIIATGSQVIEENQTLLWLIGTGSSALAGWAVYVMRKVHYQKIEGTMKAITEKIESIDGKEKEKEMEREKEKHKKHKDAALNTILVVAPAVGSAFLLGYLFGRTQGSFLVKRQIQVQESLKKDRVYVAVIPERLFEAKTVSLELERAVVEADAEKAKKPWWQRRLFSPQGQAMPGRSSHRRSSRKKDPKEISQGEAASEAA